MKDRLIFKFPMMVGVTLWNERERHVGTDWVCSHCEGYTDASNSPLEALWHDKGCPVASALGKVPA